MAQCIMASSRPDREAHGVKFLLRLLAIKGARFLIDMIGPGCVRIVLGSITNQEPLAYSSAAFWGGHCKLYLALELP